MQSDIEIQTLVNSGDISAGEAAARRAATAVAATEAELRAEEAKLQKLEAMTPPNSPAEAREYEAQLRQQKLKTAELTQTLLEQERALVEEIINRIESALTTAAREYQNEIEGQNQLLERQNTLNEQLTRGLEIRNNILGAQQSLAAATGNFIQSELDALSQTTQSEFRKQQIAQATAAIKYQMALQENEFAQRALEIELRQAEIARERELTENRIAVLRAQQDIRQGANDVQIAREQNAAGLISDSELQAKILEQENNVLNLQGLIEQRGLIEQQATQDAILGEFRRQELDLQNRSRERNAQLGLAQSLPPGLRQRSLAALGDNIAQDFGFQDQASLINAGSARARGLADEEFGVGRSVGRLSAFDPELEGLSQNLSPAERRALEADTERRFGQQFGSFAPTGPFQDQALGQGAEPLQFPPELQAGLEGNAGLGSQIDGLTSETAALESRAQEQIDAINTQTGDITTDAAAFAEQATTDAAELAATTRSSAEAQAESAAAAIAGQTDEMMTELESFGAEAAETTNAVAAQTAEVVDATFVQTAELATSISTQTTDMQLTMLDGFQVVAEAVAGISGPSEAIAQEGVAQTAGGDVQDGIEAANDALAQWGQTTEESAANAAAIQADFDDRRARVQAESEARNADINANFTTARQEAEASATADEAALADRRSAQPEFVAEREEPSLRFEAADQRELAPPPEPATPQSFTESQDRVVAAIQQSGQTSDGDTYNFEINVNAGDASSGNAIAVRVREELKQLLDRTRQISLANA